MFDLFRILNAWLAADRIRASPREAKLLRLMPGSCICIAGAAYTVQCRTIPDPNSATVAYHCRSVDTDMDLIATIADDATVHATMTTDIETKSVALEEIECFG